MIKKGASRSVFLTKKFAIKIPRMYHWRKFLYGILSNDYEHSFWKFIKDDKVLAPVLFSLPFGLLIVMPRCKELEEKDYNNYNYDQLVNKEEYVVPAENKMSSFGIYKGNIVAIDYDGFASIRSIL